MQNPRKKKTKKILVKKKKNPSQPTETVQNIPSSDYESRIPSECDDFNFDFESLKTVISQSMQDAVQSLPKDKLENMSFQDVSKLMTEKVTEAMPKNNKQGFDMSSMMATLMSNAEKMVMGNLNTTDEKTEEPKDPSGPPSLYDKAPDAPTERSGKYASIEEEKQRHLIYKGFNTVLISILNMLMEKLPHKRSHYMTLKRLIETVITTNPLKPRELWKNSIDKNPEYQDKLSKYSKENVAFICKHLHNIDPLHTLELNDEWHHFTSDDYKVFFIIFLCFQFS